MPSRLRLSIASLSSLLLVAPAPVARAQTPPPAPAETPRFTAGAEVVALDLVVRDKKGKLVTDLQPGEIEVLEDGVPQKVTSFRTIVAAAGAAVPVATAPAAPGAPATAPRARDGAAPRGDGLRPAELRRAPPRAGRRRRVREEVRHARHRGDGRAHRRRPDPGDRPRRRSRSREGGRAQGDGSDRQRRRSRRDDQRRGQQLLRRATWPLRGGRRLA